jgi:putative membrane protein
MTFLIVKSLHIIFMVTWMAGLFYLPRLFVYHAQASDRISIDRFKIMERKVYFGIATPGGVLTVLFGLWLWQGWFADAGWWMYAKLALVAVLLVYHVWCGKLLLDFKHERNAHGHVWYRWFNEFPVVVLAAIVFLVVLKPQ